MSIATKADYAPEIKRQRHRWTTLMKYDMVPHEDWIEASIIFSLIFGFLMLTGVSLYSTHGEFWKMKEMLDELFPPIIALTGCALGFYFGSGSKPR